jgi:two-component system, OmpR family, sensor kinase
MRSLRIRLILLLGVAIVVAAVTLFLTSFQAAQKSSDRLFDYHMQQMALTIQNTGLEESPWDPFLHNEENNFDFVIQIWSKDGAKLYQSRTYKFLPKRAALGFSTVTLDNGDWRVYAVQNDEQVIQIAQKMSARREGGISFALRTLWPVIPVMLLLLAVAWWVVTTALRPLERVSRQLSERSADSHASINVDGLPNEIAPLISELNSLLSRMTLTLQAQQQFIADAAHELRSPITSLKLQIHSLSKAKDETGRVRAIGRLLKGIERSSHMVEQLLALARNEPFSQLFRPQRISLGEVVRQAVDEVEPLAMSKGIALELRQPHDPYVFGEAEALQIAVRNLLDNAIRYIPENGLIRISSEINDKGACLCIEDTGSGIPLSDQARVFDRFYRVPGTDQTGTGLGLAIVKAIADRHGAKIELKDSRIGGLAVEISFSSLSTHSVSQLEPASIEQ